MSIGVRVCAEKMWRIGQEVGRAQRAMSDAGPARVMESLRQRATYLMTK